MEFCVPFPAVLHFSYCIHLVSISLLSIAVAFSTNILINRLSAINPLYFLLEWNGSNWMRHCRQFECIFVDFPRHISWMKCQWGRPKVLLAEIILVSVYLEINLEAVQLSFFREYVQYSNGNKINFPREVAN